MFLKSFLPVPLFLVCVIFSATAQQQYRTDPVSVEASGNGLNVCCGGKLRLAAGVPSFQLIPSVAMGAEGD
jgi:hypothetical protein